MGPQIERKAALTAAELRAVLSHLPNQVDAMTHSDSNFAYSSLSPQQVRQVTAHFSRDDPKIGSDYEAIIRLSSS